MCAAALCLAGYGEVTARAGTVVINEIHHNPDVKTELVEFVELHNTSPAAVSLAGWRLSSGVEFTFPAGASIAGNGYLVVSENTNAFRAKFGFTPFGPWTGNLNNFGERIVLQNAAGQVEDEVEYQLGFPWPTVGDPPGNSIELVNPSLDNDLGGSWRASGASAGTPSPGVTILSSGSTWRYVKGTNEASSPATAWRQLNFNDASWGSGALPIGYDPSIPLGTPLNDMPGAYISVFLRRTFVVTNLAQLSGLTLEAMYDDGFKVFINGANVLNANISIGELPYNGTAGAAREDATFNVFNLPPPNVGGYIVQGTNIIAIQLHNSVLSGSSDCYIDVRLIARYGGGSGSGPSPGRVNNMFANNIPPQIRRVEHSPNEPSSGQPVMITAKVTDADSVTNVTLLYQLVDPGSYIEIKDTAYTNNWTPVAMNDSGAGGDAVAGDDVYSARLPGSVQTHRRLVRYRIVAFDGGGRSVRVPYADDAQPNFAYFVYNGIPEWRGSLNGGGTATVFPSSVTGRLPCYHLISKRTSVETATWFERYGGDLYKWNGTLVYDGHVYDHIRYRARGGVWRYSMVKNMWKFDFNRGHDFEAKDDWGKKFDVPWRKLNLGASIQQRDFWHRGEQGMFEAVGFKMFNLAGVESPYTTFCTFRVIDEAAEASPTTQYEGDFWGVYLAIEQEDGRFLEEHGLPDGNLYKMEGGTGELNNMGPLGPADKSDLNYFLGNYTGASEAWWRTNLNIGHYLSYQTMVQAIHHYDICYDKNFFYYRNPVTRLWQVHSWDFDLTWANNMYDAGCGGVDRIYQRLLDGSRPAVQMQYRNRIREVRDLLWNTDQAHRLIDEYAWLLRGPTNGPTILDADRFMWDFNPKMVGTVYSQNPQKAGQGEYYQFSPEAATNSSLRGSFNGAIQIVKNYVNIRGAFLDGIANDTQIPAQPVITATGPTDFPLNRLTFRAANYSGANPFAAMKWRIAEITPTNVPVSSLTEAAKYEITATWESGDVTVFNSDVTIPSSAVKAGETYRVRCRFRDTTGRWSRWSAPVQFRCGPPDTSAALLANLRITELMYNSPAGNDYDYVELHHTGGPLPLELNGAKFTQGIDYTFGAGLTIPPGGYLVLAKATNAAAFRAYYGLSSNVAVLGPYSGNFDNGGEQVTLRTSAGGDDIASFEYSDGRGWPVSADGSGHSLVPLVSAMNGQKSGALNYGGNWRASARIKGSPGSADPEPNDAVRLNEIVAHTDFMNELDSNDWLELQNTSDAVFTFGGNWFLSDDRTNLAKWMIPADTTIPARGFVSFDEQTGFHNPTNIGFGLNKAGEEVLLSHLPGGGQDRVVDAVSFKGQENEWSLGRYPDGGPFWYGLTPRTRNGSNAAPDLGVVISELMYHPPDVGGTNDNSVDEFIEVFNPTGTPLPLFNTNGAWRIDGGVSFTFPNEVTIGAMSRLLVVNFAPTNAAQSNLFRATYGVSGDLPVFGPYTDGKLPNSSGRVALETPQAPDLPGDSVSWVIVDEVIYGDQNPWPLAADGFGPSLHREDLLRHGSDPANWQAATPTPGAAYGGGVPPTITQQPGPPMRTSPAGATITYEVAATGTEPLRYQWRHNGNNLGNATNAVLALVNAQPANSGEYHVLVLNSAGSALSETVTLFVTTPPQISVHPPSRDVRPGSNVTFTVVANGTGVLRYQWRSNSVDLAGATNASYMIHEAQLPHEGAYTVIVSDNNGAVISEPAELRILINPVITRHPQSQTVLAGEDVTFTVEITGNPPPFGYQWRKVTTEVAKFISPERTSSFTITNVQTNHAGSYRVVITNAAFYVPGIQSQSGLLTVLTDQDHDGMPDVWENTYMFSAGNPDDADDDADQDGLSNLEEYRAGTDPRDPESYLRIESIESELAISGSMRISFVAVSNRTYTVEHRDSLLPGAWNRLNDVTATTSNRIVTLIDSPPATVSRRFYRLATPRVP
ncbi:MAG: lamin tail domain-containing protein [Verrucomicrobia subdivision 3 bacterium]|nr:lamin tail domain-containing protein [Limisphaerales bacterium]